MTRHDAPVLPGGHGCQRKEVLLTCMAGADAQLQHEADALQKVLGRAGESAVSGVHVPSMEGGAQARPCAVLHPGVAASSAGQGAQGIRPDLPHAAELGPALGLQNAAHLRSYHAPV
jgi:hypothetical protein